MFTHSNDKQSPVARQELAGRRRFLRLCFLALGVISTILCTPAAHSQYPPPPTTNGPIYSILSNKKLCLQPADVPVGTSPQGAAIILEPCNGSLVQQWQRVTVTDGFPDHYVNQFSGLCMDAHGSAANYTVVQQWTCNSITNERWQYASSDLTNVHGPHVFSQIGGAPSGVYFCLDIPGGQATAGSFVQIYVCNGTDAQRWLTP
jgi:hypothetical protein